MRTLDIFRASVAAAALGFARRAADEALAHARERSMFGGTLADLQLAQAKLAEMATAIDAAALLTYRAAWLRDVKGARTTKEAAMAKWTATESAQQVIDAAVQMFGALGVTQRPDGRASVPRNSRAAHLRGRDRCAEADRRARAVAALKRREAEGRGRCLTRRMSTRSRGTTCRRGTSGRSSRSCCPELEYPERMNAATMLLDRAVERGWGSRLAVAAPDGLRWTYADLLAEANRIARVLIEDLGLVPGNRVLLRAPNSPMHAACWFAVLKAGGIAVGTMPLLRAKELTDIVTKARISHALCDHRLAAELEAARPDCPTLRTVAMFGTERPTTSTRGPRARRRRSPTSTPRPTTRRSSRSRRARRASRRGRCTSTAT